MLGSHQDSTTDLHNIYAPLIAIIDPWEKDLRQGQFLGACLPMHLLFGTIDYALAQHMTSGTHPSGCPVSDNTIASITQDPAIAQTVKELCASIVCTPWQFTLQDTSPATIATCLRELLQGYLGIYLEASRRLGEENAAQPIVLQEGMHQTLRAHLESIIPDVEYLYREELQMRAKDPETYKAWQTEQRAQQQQILTNSIAATQISNIPAPSVTVHPLVERGYFTAEEADRIARTNLDMILSFIKDPEDSQDFEEVEDIERRLRNIIHIARRQQLPGDPLHGINELGRTSEICMSTLLSNRAVRYAIDCGALSFAQLIALADHAPALLHILSNYDHSLNQNEVRVGEELTWGALYDALEKACNAPKNNPAICCASLYLSGLLETHHRTIELAADMATYAGVDPQPLVRKAYDYALRCYWSPEAEKQLFKSKILLHFISPERLIWWWKEYVANDGLLNAVITFVQQEAFLLKLPLEYRKNAMCYAVEVSDEALLNVLLSSSTIIATLEDAASNALFIAGREHAQAEEKTNSIFTRLVVHTDFMEQVRAYPRFLANLQQHNSDVQDPDLQTTLATLQDVIPSATPTITGVMPTLIEANELEMDI